MAQDVWRMVSFIPLCDGVCMKRQSRGVEGTPISVKDPQFPTGNYIAPQAGGQQLALACPYFEMLYGGQAGAGKSWVLVVDALGIQFEKTDLKMRAIDIPEYRGILFRRTSKQLAKLLDEAAKLYPSFGATYTAQRIGDPGACYEFPSGAKIFFCHMEHEKNKEDHQGQEYQFVGFDEVTHFTITQYHYLFSRTRSTVKGLFARVRSTANPAGSGMWWVRRRFITNMKPGVVKWFIAGNEKPEANPAGIEVSHTHPDALARVFVPGKLDDNKILMQADPSYKQRIKAMGKQMERALLHGDWDAFGGDFFPFDPGQQIIEPFRIPKEWWIGLSVDPGYSNPCSAGLWARDFEGNLYRICTYYERNRNPTQNARGIKSMIESNVWTRGRMPNMMVAGKDAWAHRDRLSVIANEVTFADIFESEGLMLEPAVTDRKQGWWTMKQLMPDHYFVFAGANTPHIEELTSAVADDKDQEDIFGKGNDPDVMDHTLDDARYMVMASDPPVKPKENDGEQWMSKIMKQYQESSNGGWFPGAG